MLNRQLNRFTMICIIHDVLISQRSLSRSCNYLQLVAIKYICTIRQLYSTEHRKSIICLCIFTCVSFVSILEDQELNSTNYFLVSLRTVLPSMGPFGLILQIKPHFSVF